MCFVLPPHLDGFEDVDDGGELISNGETSINGERIANNEHRKSQQKEECDRRREQFYEPTAIVDDGNSPYGVHASTAKGIANGPLVG